jgi:hypothetical protein
VVGRAGGVAEGGEELGAEEAVGVGEDGEEHKGRE